MRFRNQTSVASGSKTEPETKPRKIQALSEASGNSQLAETRMDAAAETGATVQTRQKLAQLAGA